MNSTLEQQVLDVLIEDSPCQWSFVVWKLEKKYNWENFSPLLTIFFNLEKKGYIKREVNRKNTYITKIKRRKKITMEDINNEQNICDRRPTYREQKLPKGFIRIDLK